MIVDKDNGRITQMLTIEGKSWALDWSIIDQFDPPTKASTHTNGTGGLDGEGMGGLMKPKYVMNESRT